MAALNALYESFMVQNNLVDVGRLSIQHTTLDDFVLIDTKTVSDLELLATKKSSEKSFSDNPQPRFKKTD